MRHLYLVLGCYCSCMYAQDHFQVAYPSCNFNAEILRGFNHYSKEEGYLPSGVFMNQTIPFSAGFIFPIVESRGSDAMAKRNALFYMGYTPTLQDFDVNGYTFRHQGWSGLISLHCYDLMSESDNIDLLLGSGLLFGKNYLEIFSENTNGKYSNGFFDFSNQLGFRVSLFKLITIHVFARYNLDLSRPTYRHRSGESYYIGKYKHTGAGFGFEIGFVPRTILR